MRVLTLSLVSAILMSSVTLAARERSTIPAPRTIDYDWMSVATWKQKHEANVARAAQGDVDILLLGDSITEGWGNTTLWQDHFPGKKIANFGIGGDTTANILWRLDNGEIGNLKPRVIVLLIGVNNLGRNSDSPAQVAAGIQAITSRLNSRLPATKIAILAILPSDQQPKTGLRKRIAKTNKLLAKNLHDGHTVFVLDVGDSVLEEDGTISSATMADFLHPTPAGYQRLATALLPQVERLIPRR